MIQQPFLVNEETMVHIPLQQSSIQETQVVQIQFPENQSVWGLIIPLDENRIHVTVPGASFDDNQLTVRLPEQAVLSECHVTIIPLHRPCTPLSKTYHMNHDPLFYAPNIQPPPPSNTLPSIPAYFPENAGLRRRAQRRFHQLN